MKKLAVAILALSITGKVSAECPVASDAKLAKFISRNGGINDPELSGICTRVKREGFTFLVLGDYGVRKGGSYAWVNVLLADQALGLASSSHVATATQQSEIANVQEAERLFLKAVSAAISGFMYEDAISKLRKSKSNLNEGTPSEKS